MKAIVIKCECGRVSNPIQLEIVTDIWIKNDIIHVEFNCPQCKKRLSLKIPVVKEKYANYNEMAYLMNKYL